MEVVIEQGLEAPTAPDPRAQVAATAPVHELDQPEGTADDDEKPEECESDHIAERDDEYVCHGVLAIGTVAFCSACQARAA